MSQSVDLRGIQIFPRYLDRGAQHAIADAMRDVARNAPFFTPVTRFGKPLSVRMTSAGQFGWISDRGGYRYSETHPNGSAWPDIPDVVMDVWNAVSGCARNPECCLINWYGPDARMGLHQDRDEADFNAPVVSISLGDDGLFRVGNLERGGKTESIWLNSGAVAVMGGDARLRFHGIDRIRPGTSSLFDVPGRLNLTLRVVT